MPTQAVNGGPADAVAFDPCVHYFHHAWHQNHPYWVFCKNSLTARKLESVTVRCSDAVEVISLILLFMPISIASSQSSAMVWLTVGRNVHYIQEVPRCVLLFVMQALQIKKSFITQYNYTKYEHIQFNHIICNKHLRPFVTLNLPM